MTVRNSLIAAARHAGCVARSVPWLAPATLLVTPPAAAADPPAFDLSGPGLRISVTRGTTTLPIAQVPGLAPGDKLHIAADLPDDQRESFLLVSAFLNGATNPPPKQWIDVAETWKRKQKDNSLTLTVPENAKQLVLFMVPDTGGAAGSITSAVQGRPGEFVRATQSLNQASLDRSRLDAFVAAIRAQDNTHPEYLRRIAPVLAQSLAMKLNDDCLAKVVEFQAACLLENRDSLVLSDVHSNSMAETLAGKPTDLALQLSYTREAGLGYYSPYIAVVRDLARVFGAFSNPQFNYLPTLVTPLGERLALKLNTAPSFAKPKSVMVIPMPAIGADRPPRLRNGDPGPLCGARTDLKLPVEGAPLVFSTAYAHDMKVQLTPPGGSPLDLPVEARADRAGFVLDDAAALEGLHGTVRAQLHGKWGFEPFDGPEFTLQFPDAGNWRPAQADEKLVVGRSNVLRIVGSAPACIERVTMQLDNGAPQPVTWAVAGDDAAALTLPLDDAQVGDVTIEIRQYGAAAPATMRLDALAQAARLDGLDAHAGDDRATLSGLRLDQVQAVTLGGIRMVPGSLSRDGDRDRLALVAAEGARLPATGGGVARVSLDDGRTLTLPVRLAAPRPTLALIGKRTSRPADAWRIGKADGELVASDAVLDFSIRAGDDATKFRPSDAVEVSVGEALATLRLSSGHGLQRESDAVLVARLDAGSFGPSVAGPLRFRLVRDGVASDWVPLGVLVRLPRIAGIDCGTPPASRCTVRGEALNLIDSIMVGSAAIAVPQGFVGRTIELPAPASGTIGIRLRDAPDLPVTLRLSSSG
ncbi:hypothetical protein ACX40Y_14215 [Sphingomonas sp. RS6]